MTNYGRTSESEIAEAVRCILEKIGGSAPVQLIIDEIPNFVALTSADRAKSFTRPGEEVWEQQVRNIVSHRRSRGNYIHDGLLEYRAGMLAIPGMARASAQLVLTL